MAIAADRVARSSRYRSLDLALPASLALFALFVRLSVGPLIVDDAYIIFRYARNLATGLGLVYNPGEHVLGTSTPLYTLLLAGLYWLGFHDLPRLAPLLTALADAFTAAVLFRLGGRIGLGQGWSALLALLFCLAPLSIAYAAGGMESSIYTLLVVGAVAADAARRPGWAGLLAGLAAVTRIEGLLVGALILGRHLVDLRLPPRRAVLAFGALVLGWTAYATWWFGSPVPQTVLAKAVAYQAPLVPNLQGMLGQTTPSGWLGLPAVLLLPFASREVRRRRELWALAAFPLLLVGGYTLAAVRQHTWVFGWYLVPLVPFYLLALVAAMRRGTAWLPRPLAALAGLALLVTVLPGLSLGGDSGRSAFTPRSVNLVRESAFLAAARLLEPRVDSRSLVALPEIGAFGYASEARILDGVGLVSPEATPYYPLGPDYRGDNAVPAGLIEAKRPDYLVGLDQYFQPPLVGAEWFRCRYALIASFDARIWGSRAVVVYEKQDPPLCPAGE